MMKKVFLVLILGQILFHAQAFADDLAVKNRVARRAALAEMQRLQDNPYETPYFKVTLAKLARLGAQAGPLCLQLKKGCYTQRQLGYRSSEYYALGELKNLPKAGIYTSIWEARFPSTERNALVNQVAEANGVSPLTIMYAIELNEKLGIAYLAHYRNTHPNRPTKKSGNTECSYSWQISEDAQIAEHEACYGDGD